MTLTVDRPPPAAVRSPWAALLSRIADETELSHGGIHVAGRPLARSGGRQLLIAVLTDALHETYVLTPAGDDPRPAPGRRGDAFFARFADALGPQFLGGSGWRLIHRTAAGTPSLVATRGALDDRTDRAGCYLDLRPASAPEVFARLLTTLEGYGLDFDARLAGDAQACRRADPAVVTVARAELPLLGRAAIRLRQRLPFAFRCSVPAFTLPTAPGIALADEPRSGAGLGRERCRVIAGGLVAAGPGAGPAKRRAAIDRALIDACLDPAALHLEPGNPPFGSV